MNLNIQIPDTDAMQAFAAQLSPHMVKGAIIYLQGDLGAGKTTFTRGFLRGLGYTGHVKSPTYTIVEAYELPNLMVFHFDFYRLQDPEELEYLGIKDYFSKESICLIEWPDLGGDMVPAPDLRCYFTIEQDTRHLTIHAESDLGKKILGRL